MEYKIIDRLKVGKQYKLLSIGLISPGKNFVEKDESTLLFEGTISGSRLTELIV